LAILVSRPNEKAATLRQAMRLIGAGLVAAFFVAGCAGSGFNYIKSSDDKTYFKVPDRWTLYDEGAILNRLGPDLSDSERAAELDASWRVAFDADPRPSLKHLGDNAATHPSGLAVVRKLDFDAADNVSLNSMRNYFFDVDSALQNQTGDVATYDELQLDGGFRGIHMVANLDMGTDGKITLDQTVLVDQATTKIYALLVSCSSVCYERNHGDIEKVVDSWTVRAK
jgi:hypothetical protein